jgi:hypothetical protein
MKRKGFGTRIKETEEGFIVESYNTYGPFKTVEDAEDARLSLKEIQKRGI